LTPYLTVNGAAQAIAFYKRAFGAVERYRLAAPNGTAVWHAEIQIGDSIIMLADESPEHGARSPQSLNGSPCSFLLYVDDVDAVFARAVEAGATVRQPLENRFYGDRVGSLVDPFGHRWDLATHVENVGPEEIRRRAMAMAAATS
jgi:PhnB protein